MINDFAEWIGRSAAAPADCVSPRLISGFTATLGGALAEVCEVPLGLHWCLCPEADPAQELAEDGHRDRSKGGLLPPVPISHRMWAGGKVEFLGELQPGDLVERHSKIADIAWKKGRSGELCFVTVSHQYLVDGDCRIREEQVLVYRDPAGGQAPTAPTEPQASDHETTVSIDNVMLFRYSALTFNAHRIHYDLAWCREHEGFEDIVIHGPLQATLLLNFAAQRTGKAPRRFSYRGMAPATGAQSLRLITRNQANGLELAVITQAGAQSMSATAEF